MSDWDDDVLLMQHVIATNTVVIAHHLKKRREQKKKKKKRKPEEEAGRRKKRGCRVPRSARRFFDHGRAKDCIMSDYLAPDALFSDMNFVMMFRISRGRFQKILEDIGNSGIPFYNPQQERKNSSCLEARLLLPLKTLAYGVPPHCFSDYFQMSKAFTITAAL